MIDNIKIGVPGGGITGPGMFFQLLHDHGWGTDNSDYMDLTMGRHGAYWLVQAASAAIATDGGIWLMRRRRASRIGCASVTFAIFLCMTALSNAQIRLPIATKDPGVSASWRAWRSELRRRCPSHHVEWICDGCYDELLAGFDQTLAPNAKRRIAALEDYSRRCVMETGGFGCEMGVGLEAYRRLGLLGKFTAYGCRHYECEAAALCTAIGPGAANHH